MNVIYERIMKNANPSFQKKKKHYQIMSQSYQLTLTVNQMPTSEHNQQSNKQKITSGDHNIKDDELNQSTIMYQNLSR